MTPSTQNVRPLRQRMIDDRRMRKFADKTQSDYLRSVGRAVCRLPLPPARHRDRRRPAALPVAPGRSRRLGGSLAAGVCRRQSPKSEPSPDALILFSSVEPTKSVANSVLTRVSAQTGGSPDG